MHIRNRTMFGFAFGVALLLAFAVAGSGPSAAEELGLAVKNPLWPQLANCARGAQSRTC